jgi:hypothetical protein
MDKIKIERVTVTRDELKNGWDDKTLRQYIAERTEAQEDKINPHSAARRKKPEEQNHRYRIHRWRD